MNFRGPIFYVKLLAITRQMNIGFFIVVASATCATELLSILS